MRWLVACGTLLVVALALFAVPAGLEGPTLVPISPGHALSVLDLLAVPPLLAATGILAIGLWRRRRRLAASISRSPGWATAVVFGAGAGLGLLLASVLEFFWWWAISAALFTVALSAMTLSASREPETGER
jgi:hypothetical protein